MSNDFHVSEQLPAYALGSLEREEAVQISEHLTTCPECRAELVAYEAVAGRLALALPDAVPPAGLQQRIMDGLQRPDSETSASSQRPWRQWFGDLFGRATPAWGVAGLALVALLVVSILWWRQRVDGSGLMLTPGGMQVVALVGTDVAREAVGTLVINEDGEYGALIVDGLPALDDQYQYQIWLIRDGQRTGGGVFSVNDEGYGVLWIESPEPLSSYAAFGITQEPAGGSPGPTGRKVLGSWPISDSQ